MNLSDIFFFSPPAAWRDDKNVGEKGGGGVGGVRQRKGWGGAAFGFSGKKIKNKNTNLTRDTRAIKIITLKRGKGVRENRAGGLGGAGGWQRHSSVKQAVIYFR